MIKIIRWFKNFFKKPKISSVKYYKNGNLHMKFIIPIGGKIEKEAVKEIKETLSKYKSESWSSVK